MNLKTLKSIIPYLSVYIIIVGIIRSIIFYSYFNIRILDYIGLDEIILLFADDIIFTILFYITPFIIITYEMYPTLSVFEQNTQRKKSSTQNFEKKLNRKTFEISNKNKIRILNLTALALTIAIAYISKFYYFTFIIFFNYWICYLVILICLKFENHLSNTHNFKLDKSIKVIIACSIAFIFMSNCLSALSASTNYIGFYNGSSITTNDTTFYTSDTIVYVGKTKDYSFLYNKNSNKSTVIKNDNIKYAYIKRKDFNYYLLTVKSLLFSSHIQNSIKLKSYHSNNDTLPIQTVR